MPRLQARDHSVDENDLRRRGHQLSYPELGSRHRDPKAPSRAPLDKRVPDDLAEDYRQACLVLPDSPKASAALSRRCLQHLLRDTAGIKKRNLDEEIGEAIDSSRLTWAKRSTASA